MAGRGGRGARGGARSLPPSVSSHAYIPHPAPAQVTSKSNMPVPDNTPGNPLRHVPGPLFPDITLPVPGDPEGALKTLWFLQDTMNQWIRQSPFCLPMKHHTMGGGVVMDAPLERYTDKYFPPGKTASKIHDIETDITSLPDELLVIYRPEKAKGSKQQQQQMKMMNVFDKMKLDELEKLDTIQGNKGTKEEEIGGDEVEVEEEEDDEEDMEDETDYAFNYFDNGEEDYGYAYDDGAGADEYE